MKLRPLDKVFIVTFLIIIVVGLYLTMDHYQRLAQLESKVSEEMVMMDMDLDSLPLEEPQAPLKPKIIIENGKTIKVFNISIEAIKKELRPGVYVEAWGFNRQVPGPELRVKEGDLVRVYFTNKHTKNHTIHWHGVHVPTEMDGVPGVSQYEVGPNETFTYEFTAGPSGTRMYHCHVDTDHHMDMGMYGPIIIEDKEEDLSKYDQEITLVLSDFNTKHNPALHAGEESEYFSKHNQYKIEYDHYLINGKAFPAIGPIIVKENDLIKIRMVQAGKTPKSFHLHGHSFLVTHKDGFPVPFPQEMDTLPILPGETYDLELRAKNKGAWVFHDHITRHVTNDGFYPGGALIVLLYEGYTAPWLSDYLGKIEAYNQKATELGYPPEQGMQEMDHSMMNMG